MQTKQKWGGGGGNANVLCHFEIVELEIFKFDVSQATENAIKFLDSRGINMFSFVALMSGLIDIDMHLMAMMGFYMPKNYHLFKVDKNRMQQCCATHIVHSSTILFSIVTPDCRLIQAHQC